MQYSKGVSNLDLVTIDTLSKETKAIKEKLARKHMTGIWIYVKVAGFDFALIVIRALRLA